MPLNIDQESLHDLIFTPDLYVNPRSEHKNNKNNTKLRLVLVFLIMFFLLLIVSSVVMLVRTAPIEHSDSTTTFSTEKYRFLTLKVT